MSIFTVGDLIAVQTETLEFNSRVWEVVDIGASASRCLILVSADGLLDDDGSLKRISVAEDRCAFNAVVPLETETLATQTPSQSSTDPWQLATLVVPRAFEAQFELLTRFIFGDHGPGSSRPPLNSLNTWIPLPLLGGNMIRLVESPYPEYELVMYPQLYGYQLHFFSEWGRCRCVIVLADCDILTACLACKVWPWCAFCHKFLTLVEIHRGSKKHDQCRQWCQWHIDETRRLVKRWLPENRRGLLTVLQSDSHS